MAVTYNGIRKKVLKKLIHIKLKKRVKNKTFTIICNNCWGGHIYQQLELPYSTPTIGLFFYAPCYIKFLENFEVYLREHLKFIETSKYEKSEHLKSKGWYPIGQLGDIEVHFLHYSSEEEAYDKWEKRKMRINRENLFVVGSERDLCNSLHIERFQKLPFQNKIFFTANSYPDTEYLIHIKEYSNQGEVGDIFTENLLVHKYLDIPKWLNRNQ